MSKLQVMVDAAKSDAERRRAEISLESLEDRLEPRRSSGRFREALVQSGLSVIAEYKRRSPSLGEISGAGAVADRVSAYERGGAAALSVLTEAEHFGGSLDDLCDARQASDLPILRKDFIVDRYQLVEAAVHGADAVLLIAAALEGEKLGALYREAGELELDCIVEIRDRPELETALLLDAKIIGINNRNLETLEVNISTTFDLMSDVPDGTTIVAESGFSSRSELLKLEGEGVDAALIGTALMQAADPEGLTRDLTGHGEAVVSQHMR